MVADRRAITLAKGQNQNLKTWHQISPKSGMGNFVRIPSIYVRLTWVPFIGEPPNPARAMNVCGAPTCWLPGGNTKWGD
jgi:hypothetical protein